MKSLVMLFIVLSIALNFTAIGCGGKYEPGIQGTPTPSAGNTTLTPTPKGGVTTPKQSSPTPKPPLTPIQESTLPLNGILFHQFGSGQGAVAVGVAVDSESNIYVAGSVKGALPNQISSGQVDGFVRKYDAAGNELWTRQYSPGSISQNSFFAVDNLGNIYLLGGYLRKWDTNGVEFLHIEYGYDSRTDASYNCIAADKQGCVYLVGRVFAPNPQNIPSRTYDAFLHKYSPTGERLWDKRWGYMRTNSTSSFDENDCVDEAYSVTLDANDNIYVSGSTEGDETQPGNRPHHAFLNKYDANGILEWSVEYGISLNGSGEEARVEATNVIADSQGNVYVAGGAFGNSGANRFLRKYDTNGNELWTQQYNSYVTVYDLCLNPDKEGSLYMLAASDMSNAIIKYNSQGSELWTSEVSKTTKFGQLFAEASDTSDNLYIVGGTYGPDFGWVSDAFIVKIKAD